MSKPSIEYECHSDAWLSGYRAALADVHERAFADKESPRILTRQWLLGALDRLLMAGGR